MGPIDLHVITGQTASGKSAVAFEIAVRSGTGIISADSMKIYRGMDIGTAKPSVHEREKVDYRLLDVTSPSEDFSAAKFVEMADAAIAETAETKKPVLIEGGTPLYIKVLTEGMFDGPERDPALRAKLKERSALEGVESLYGELEKADPEAASHINPTDLRRIIRALEVYQKTGRKISELQTQFGSRRTQYNRRIVALRRERDELRKRIEQRIGLMFERGLVEEVKSLAGRSLGRTASQAIGYREVAGMLAGEITEDEAREEMRRRTWTLARRQMTWLKSFPDILFYDIAPGEPASETATAVGRILGLLE